MNRYLGSVLLVALGIVLGSLGTSYLRTPEAAAAQAAGDNDMAAAEMVADIRETKNQVTEINTLLQSGKLLVVLAINPDASDR